jgi:hypothetical protein
MNVNLTDVIGPSKSRSKGTNLVAGSENTIYTCPANYTAKMLLLFVANTTGGNKTISISWHDSSEGETYAIVGRYNIHSYSFLKLDGSYLTLNSGDYLIVTPESNSTMHATVTVEEYFDPTHNKQ